MTFDLDSTLIISRKRTGWSLHSWLVGWIISEGGKEKESVLFLKKTHTDAHTKSEDITEKLTKKTLPDVKEEVMSHDDIHNKFQALSWKAQTDSPPNV